MSCRHLGRGNTDIWHNKPYPLSQPPLPAPGFPIYLFLHLPPFPLDVPLIRHRNLLTSVPHSRLHPVNPHLPPPALIPTPRTFDSPLCPASPSHTSGDPVPYSPPFVEADSFLFRLHSSDSLLCLGVPRRFLVASATFTAFSWTTLLVEFSFHYPEPLPQHIVSLLHF